jgi:hypothetical protein
MPATFAGMEDVLMLPVRHKGEDLEFPFRVAAQGFSHRYIFIINEIEIIYEQDDHGEFRAIVHHPEEVKAKLPERGLLEAIGDTLRQIA